jgi:hypothetical protein
MPTPVSISDVICDSEFLEQRASEAACEAEMEALRALADADLERSRRHVRRAMADSLHGWRRCGLKCCRRARRCKTALTQCVGVRHNAWPLADERSAIDDTYAALQHYRLRMAEEAAEAEQARE